MTVSTLDEISEVEARYTGLKGKPSLGEAYRLLDERWASGLRDRETILRLMFLAWYSAAEPHWLTGLPNDLPVADIIHRMFMALGGESSSDAEMLFAVSVYTEIAAWCWGDESTWEAIGRRCRARAHRLAPHWFTPDQFASRGAYGEYLAHMVRRGVGAA